MHLLQVKSYIKILDPCSDKICEINTDTCYKGECQCGDSIGSSCSQESQLPFCVDGSCKCSKSEDEFKSGDGTTRGTCRSPSAKCQASGRCFECSYSSQCPIITNGLADTCRNNQCVCGGDQNSQICNGKLSSRCANGICLCGTNPQCSGTKHIEELDDCTEEECGNTPVNGICGCYFENGKCKVPRSDQEICQKISRHYNPLHIAGELNYDGQPVILCDDRIGSKDNIGKYFCLGNV